MQPGANPDLEQTLDRHGSFVRRLARSLVFDENRADDVAQEAWLAATKHPPRDAMTARGWFAKVVRNFSFRMRREDVRRREREQRAARPEIATRATAAPAEAAMLREVVEAVVGLDEPYRSTVLMRFYENLEPAEIAERLGVPAATVRTRLKRALDQLREQFDAAHGDRRAWAAPLLPIALGALKPAAIAVTAAAGGAVAASSASAFSGITLGGILMAKKIGIAFGLVAIAVVSVVVATHAGGDKNDDVGQTPQGIRVAEAPAPVEAPAMKPVESAPITAQRYVPSAEEASPQVPEIQLAAKGAPSATVVGRVVDQKDVPQPNVPVTLRTMEIVTNEGGDFGVEVGNEVTNERQLQTKTGLDGRFTFAELPLNIEARVRARPEKLCDVVRPASISKAGTVDLGDLAAAPGGSIAGTVVGPTGAAVKNCQVAAWSTERSTSAGIIRLHRMGDPDTRTAVTNANGQYRIDGIPDGECSVAASSDDHPRETRGGVVIRVNEVTWETDFKLATGATLTGVVRDAEGHPLSGVAVVASPAEMLIDGMEGSGPGPKKATTGPDGRFTLQGLRAEPTNVRARKAGFVPATQRQVAAGTEVTLTLRPCGIAFGHVRNAITNEPVAEFTLRVAKDRPMVDLQNRARVLRGAEAAKAAQVDESPGLFAVVDMPDSPMQIHVQAEEFADAEVGPVHATPGEKTEVDVLLNPQAMIRGTVVDATGAPVEGARVNITNAKPEPTLGEGGMRFRTNRRVVTRREGPAPAEEPTVSRAATSGADGSFVIKGLPGGNYRLTAGRRGFAVGPPTEVEVKPSGLVEGVRLTLEMAGTFAGRALDPDGNKIAGAHISLKPTRVPGSAQERIPESAISDAAGEFEFASLRPGEYVASIGDDTGEASMQFSLAFGDEDEAPQEGTPVTVEAGKTVRKDLQQKPRASLSGIVKEGGKPAAGVKVTLIAKGMPEFLGGTSTRTDDNGAFVLEKVPPGDYTVMVDPPGAALPTRKSVALAPRAEQRITIDLPTGAIEGRITDKATGKPVAGITVSAEIEEGGEAEQTFRGRAIVMATTDDDDAGSISTIAIGGASDPVRTDDDGRYRLRYLGPAKYRVSIKGAGITPQSKPNVAVEENKTTKDIDFGVEKGATLVVSIDPAGHDVAQVFGFANLVNGDSHEVGSGTVKNGVKFSGLKPGRYHVRIDAPMADLEGSGDVDVVAGQEARLTVRLAQRE